jgi:hypothetical protein
VQLCHRPTVASNSQPLAAQDTVDDLAPMVTQIPNGYFINSATVSPVIEVAQMVFTPR